jgi:hypothetical protein
LPEVVCVDGTHETNNESRPLLTLSVKDSDGNVIVVIRYFVPNERLFHWLFQKALPVLLGTQTLQLVKLVMTDGDSQEMAQVDFAIAELLVNAVPTHCGWSLVHQGWRQECRDLGFRKGKRDAARSQVRVILRQLQTLAMNVSIMLSNLVLLVFFYSMRLTNPPRFNVIWILTNLTSFINI